MCSEGIEEALMIHRAPCSPTAQGVTVTFPHPVPLSPRCGPSGRGCVGWRGPGFALRPMEAAAMEPTEEESAGGDVAVGIWYHHREGRWTMGEVQDSGGGGGGRI
jgi:hypothetical protein